jgi:hypothetical protein
MTDRLLYTNIASKCRQRKKEWIEGLAHKAERMSRENEHLKQLLLQLKEETLFLKTQLMMHKGYISDATQILAFVVNSILYVGTLVMCAKIKSV